MGRALYKRKEKKKKKGPGRQAGKQSDSSQVKPGERSGLTLVGQVLKNRPLEGGVKVKGKRGLGSEGKAEPPGPQDPREDPVSIRSVSSMRPVCLQTDLCQDSLFLKGDIDL